MREKDSPTFASRLFTSLEMRVVIVSAVSFLGLITLRGVLEEYHSVLFLCTLALFMVPGVLLTHWFFRDCFPGLALFPAAFVFSAAMFGLTAVPLLILSRSLDGYLLIAGAVLFAFLIPACVFATTGRASGVADEAASADPATKWLRLVFLALGTVLALGPRTRAPLLDGDSWVYLAHVREHLNTQRLAVYDPYFGTRLDPVSRAKINGWLLEQAGLSRVSGLDPLELVLYYLAPALAVLALLAFYALARVLLKNEAAALFAGSLYALFLLAYLEPSTVSFGGEFVGRIVQDKFAARFIFLPVALGLAAFYAKRPAKRYVLGFGLVCWGVVTVHPIGLAVIGICAAGFGLLYVAVNWREPGAWFRMVALAAATCSVAIVPITYIVISGEPLSTVRYSADIAGTDPVVLANQVFVREEWRHIFVLGDGNYIMHPYLLKNPVMLAGFLLGLPFLLWRLQGGVAAQLLLGALLVVTTVSYVPQAATFVGERVVGAGQLWRLAWPIPPLILLTLAWIGWELLSRFREPRERPETRLRTKPFFPALLVAALALVLTPAILPGLLAIRAASETPRHASSCFDPTLGWLRENLETPSVVLAPEAENVCIPALSANANVISLRGPAVLNHLPELERAAGTDIEVPQHMRDVRRFFTVSTYEEGIRILRRHEVDYVLVFQGSPLDAQLNNLSGFSRLDTPGNRYALYAVDLRELGSSNPSE